MRLPARLLACMLLTLVAAVLTPGCGTGQVGGPTSGAPSPSPSVSRAAQAKVHPFAGGYFSLAYDAEWVATFPDGRLWYVKDAPAGQPAQWSMVLTGHLAGRPPSARPMVVIRLYRSGGAVQPATFQHDAAGRLDARYPYDSEFGPANVHHMFEPVTVAGNPALMAAFRGPDRSPVFEVEHYVFDLAGLVCEIKIQSPAAT
jgi:hypothetical protein